jgi:HAD superfamily hydrolase (TIGR01509 family)
LFQEHGVDLQLGVWSSVIGMSSKEHFDPYKLLEQKTGKAIDRSKLESTRFAREMALCYAQPILPGVVDTILAAKDRGFKLAVASSSSRAWVVGHLDRLGLLPFFEFIHTADDVERTKPDPELFNLALASLDLRPQEAVVFEDSPNGVAAAKAAGIFVVAVPNELTRQLPLEHADIILNSLVEATLDTIIAMANHRKP